MDQLRKAQPVERRGVRRRWPMFVLGWLFFALGALGATMPVLPTTPFMLLALWAFARSSPRFHAWLLAHRLFGPALRDWQRRRVLPLRIKLVAWGSMLLSLIYVTGWVRPAWYALATMAAVMAYGSWYIARIPSRAPASTTAQPAPRAGSADRHRDGDDAASATG